ncbi:hypothetical protein [Acidisoma cladoniae]|uniref:hypothetical protein n=1 Tax=Acidisoma cladoniae TaxID=3040935 RepID=UPI00254FA14A|nr:hypothetical protein [Acidisoma sp. PAMC 29798]
MTFLRVIQISFIVAPLALAACSRAASDGAPGPLPNGAAGGAAASAGSASPNGGGSGAAGAAGAGAAK